MAVLFIPLTKCPNGQPRNYVFLDFTQLMGPLTS